MRSLLRTFSLVLFLLTLTAQAQETVGGAPLSIRHGWDRSDVPTIDASEFEMASVRTEDEERARVGDIPLYGRFQVVMADPVEQGSWRELANGDRVWRLRIRSLGALALELFCQDFQIPGGALFHVFDDSGDQIHGGYTAYNSQPDGSFSSDMIHGDVINVEYYEPAPVRGQGHFKITDVAHAYRMVHPERAKASDPCEVDVNCSEGLGWEAQRDAVVRIRVVIPQGVAYCTGTLVNNTAQDCKGYILSAMHCSEGSTSTNFNQYQFRFKYERSGCGTGSVPSGHTVTGCTRRADSNDNGGNSGSDFVLLELNNPIPASYQPYYAGWNAGTTASPNGKSIHHPAGDFKSISTYTNPLVNSGWGIVGSHWRVLWSATTNGHGVTEGGSSGSPIFDPAKRIVGTLTGGGSCCTANGCGPGTGPNVSDYYGKMSYHWTQNPNSSTQKLKVWLDPLDQQTLVLDGSYDPCATIGMNEWGAEEQLLVHPNPARTYVTVGYPPSIHKVDRILMTDPGGRMVRTFTPNTAGGTQLDLSGLSPGAYLITTVLEPGRVMSNRLIVLP